MKRIFILSITALFLFSCGPLNFTAGRSFPMDKISSVNKDKTTMEEAKKIFGEPQMTGIDESERPTWTYIYIEAEVPLSGPAKKEVFKRLTLTFEDKKVKFFSYEGSK